MNVYSLIVEDGQVLLRTYSTMMANDSTMNMQDNYDTILENAQRTLFLKELFAQVASFVSKK